MTETFILTRIAAGHPDAVEECLNRYGALVWSLTRRMTRTESDAEDAVQEIFVEIWKNAGRYDPEIASEATFISTIARRRLIDRLRRRKQDETTSLDQIDVESPVDRSSDVELNEQASRALKRVRELPAAQSKVILLSIYHGMSQSMIADTTGMPLGTVKTNMRRGLAKLRESLAAAAL